MLIGGGNSVTIARGQSVTPLADRLAHRLQELVPTSADADRSGFDDPPRTVHITHVIGGGCPNENTPIGYPNHYAFGNELAERLSQRIARDTERSRDRLLGQPGTRAQPTFIHLRPQHRGSALGGGRTHDVRPGGLECTQDIVEVRSVFHENSVRVRELWDC